ncbi:hypothetical protein AALH12_07075 [Streptococcus ferus]|uniref:hypothetical protein n=1 Tax=Streptococcus ferus TaxID=1345 RepID=UPI003517481B
MTGGYSDDYYLKELENIYESFFFSMKMFGSSYPDCGVAFKEALDRTDKVLDRAVKNKDISIRISRKRLDVRNRIERTYMRLRG